MPNLASTKNALLALLLPAALAVSGPALAAPPVVPGHGLDLTSLDTSVKPCDDFYQYANGKWLARTAIPAEYPASKATASRRLPRSSRELMRSMMSPACWLKSDTCTGKELGPGGASASGQTRKTARRKSFSLVKAAQACRSAATTDAKNFSARASGIVAQYSAYEPLPGQHINGSLTQGENIADVGGLKIAYLALEKSLAGKPKTLIDGYTPEQRFFIAFAHAWHDKRLPAYAKVALATDPHSPDPYRVLGVLADTSEFRQAFGCPPDPAAPPAIW